MTRLIHSWFFFFFFFFFQEVGQRDKGKKLADVMDNRNKTQEKR